MVQKNRCIVQFANQLKLQVEKGVIQSPLAVISELPLRPWVE